MSPQRVTVWKPARERHQHEVSERKVKLYGLELSLFLSLSHNHVVDVLCQPLYGNFWCDFTSVISSKLVYLGSLLFNHAIMSNGHSACQYRLQGELLRRAVQRKLDMDLSVFLEGLKWMEVEDEDKVGWQYPAFPPSLAHPICIQSSCKRK